MKTFILSIFHPLAGMSFTEAAALSNRYYGYKDGVDRAYRAFLLERRGLSIGAILALAFTVALAVIALQSSQALREDLRVMLPIALLGFAAALVPMGCHSHARRANVDSSWLQFLSEARLLKRLAPKTASYLWDGTVAPAFISQMARSELAPFALLMRADSPVIPGVVRDAQRVVEAFRLGNAMSPPEEVSEVYGVEIHA